MIRTRHLLSSLTRACILMLAIASGWMAGASPGWAADVTETAAYKRGRLLYIQCRACHELQADGPRKVGPHLAGIIGRPVAAVGDFGYSQALESANLVWDEATLDRFLHRPSQVVPGNTMAFAGIANPADRAALIAYLAVETAAAR